LRIQVVDMLTALLDSLFSMTGLTEVVVLLAVGGAALVASDVPPEDSRPRPDVTFEVLP
jgi:hypothetical protein